MIGRPSPTRDEVLGRIDLVELIGRHTGRGVRVGGNHGMSACPSAEHAQTGSTPPVSLSLGVVPQLWHCHGCGEGGTAVDVLRVALRLDRRQAWLATIRLAGLPVDDWPGAPTRIWLAPPSAPTRFEPLDAVKAAPLLDRFLAERKWSPDVAAEHRLEVVCDQSGRPRVRFPFVPADPLSPWQARDVSSSTRFRWLTPAGQRASVPYRADHIDVARTEGCIAVVEGLSDEVAWAHARHVAPVAIAAPGAEAWRRPWAEALIGLHVVIVGDNDAAGENYRRRVERSLDGVAASVRQLRLSETGDVADLLREAGRARFVERIADVLALAHP